MVDSAMLDWPTRIPKMELWDVPSDSVAAVLVDGQVACALSCTNKKGKPQLYMYDIRDFTCLRSFLPYGTGNGEMLMPFMTKNHGELLIYDPVKKQVAVMEIQDYAFDEDKMPQSFDTNIFSQEMIPVGGRILFLNQYSFQGQAPRVRYSDRRWNYRETKTYRFDAANVVDGTLQYNPSLGRIAFLADYEPVIEFLDTRVRPEKTLVFPHSVCKFEAVNHKDQNIVEYLYPHRENPAFPDYSFVAADSNEQHIAAVFWREDWQFVVLILDWEGSILDGFCTGARVRNISIDRESKFVYCWEEHDARNKLLQYAIL